jgi:uncharacterized protein YycO
MAENGSPEQEKELTPKQEMLIAALIAGNTIAVAAKAVGVGERTAYTWLKQPLFQQEYQAAKQVAFNEILEEFRNDVSVAIQTLKRNMTEAAPYVQVQAAKIWLDMTFSTHQNDNLEQKHAEILQKLKEIGVKP